MKILFPILLISVSLSAQERIKKQLTPKLDTIGISKLNSKKIQPPQKSDQRNIYKMPSAKPKEGTEYSGLKNKKTDATDYKMPNSITPEESKTKQEDEKSTTITK